MMTAAAVPRLASRVRGGLAYRANWWQAARFLAVGVSGLAVNVGVFAVLVHGAGAQYLLGAVCSNVIAMGSNFLWNRRWTFGATDGQAKMQASRFVVVSVSALVVNLIVLQIAVDVVALPALPSEILACAVAAPVNFLGSRQWAFRSEQASCGPRAGTSSPRDAAAMHMSPDSVVDSPPAPRLAQGPVANRA